jgi:hypothetical protein
MGLSRWKLPRLPRLGRRPGKGTRARLNLSPFVLGARDEVQPEVRRGLRRAYTRAVSDASDAEVQVSRVGSTATAAGSLKLTSARAKRAFLEFFPASL